MPDSLPAPTLRSMTSLAEDSVSPADAGQADDLRPECEGTAPSRPEPSGGGVLITDPSPDAESIRSESPPPETLPSQSGRSLILSSGHEVRFRKGLAREEIEVRSPSGGVELVIHLTKDGPVARIAGSSLELVTPGKLGIHCAELEIRAAQRMTMEAGGAVLLKTDGEIRMRSAEQTFIDGDYVNINCLDRAGYHDAGPPEDDGRNG